MNSCGQRWQWLEGRWRVCPRATTTGGALNHAPPVNSDGRGGRIVPSLLSSLAGDVFHGDLHNNNEQQRKTQTQKIKTSLDLRSAFLLGFFFSPSPVRVFLDDLHTRTKIHNATTQHKIDFILFRSRVCFCLLLLGMAGPPWVRLRAERAGRRCCCRGRGGGCGRGATPVADDGDRWWVSDLARLREASEEKGEIVGLISTGKEAPVAGWLVEGRMKRELGRGEQTVRVGLR